MIKIKQVSVRYLVELSQEQYDHLTVSILAGRKRPNLCLLNGYLGKADAWVSITPMGLILECPGVKSIAAVHIIEDFFEAVSL